jgi:hypothetical protein
MPIKHPGLTEAHVQQTVTQFLELDGWRYIRTHPLPPIVQRLDAIMAKAPRPLGCAWQQIRPYVMTHTNAETFGEKGMPDALFVRYRPAWEHYPKHPCTNVEYRNETLSESLWIEFKLPGKKPDSHQNAWHAAERARGALVKVVDDIDDFMREWYPASGLQRRAPIR